MARKVVIALAGAAVVAGGAAFVLLYGTSVVPGSEVVSQLASHVTGLDCGSPDAKQLAVEVVQKNPPAILLATASRNSGDAIFYDCTAKFEAVSVARKKCFAAIDPPYASCWDDPQHDETICGGKIAECAASMPAEQQDQDNEACRSTVREQTVAHVVYSIKNIRIESKDATTGALRCNVTLHVDLPGGPPIFSADEEIGYKLEKMEGGGTHIDLTGLQ